MSIDLDSVKMPPRVAALDRDARGFPITYGTLRAADGTPNFTVPDTVAYLDCMTGGRCSICGDGLTEDDVWFVGSPCETFDPRGVFTSPPKHRACATYSMQVCPHLAVPDYKGRTSSARRRIAEGLDEASPIRALFAQEPAERPNTFVMARADGYLLTGSFPEALRVVPNRPFLEVEEWRAGQRVMHHRSKSEMTMLKKRGLGALKADKLTYSHLSPIQKQVWNGEARGVFPWTDAEAFMAHVENSSRKPKL
jgi:hypothetical protein